jgi:GalNAc5-diNAcBac-PP-undecaprenol beta-1,3-glucosyltransferase
VTRASVLVPTFDHGPTLTYSVGSALAQTVEDLEVVIIGDGIPDTARDVIADLQRSDARVRFLEFPKGPRTGDVHRHAVLQQVTGRIVCYLEDDDLWLPTHVEYLERALESYDFASSMFVALLPGGHVDATPGDSALPFYREATRAGQNPIYLSAAAHTLNIYRRLPRGWNTPPDGVASDAHMWRQFAEHPGCRMGSTFQPTALFLSAERRPGWTPEERVAELAEYSGRLADPTFQVELYAQVLTAIGKAAPVAEANGAWAAQELARTQAELAAARAELEARATRRRGFRTGR